MSKLEALNEQITYLRGQIEGLKKENDGIYDKLEKTTVEKTVEFYQSQISEKEKQISEKEKQISELFKERSKISSGKDCSCS